MHACLLFICISQPRVSLHHLSALVAEKVNTAKRLINRKNNLKAQNIYGGNDGFDEMYGNTKELEIETTSSQPDHCYSASKCSRLPPDRCPGLCSTELYQAYSFLVVFFLVFGSAS